MKRNLIIAVVVIAGITAGYFLLNRGSSDSMSDIIVTVQMGDFRVEIETTGELEAKSSVPIMGPVAMRNFRVYNLTIQDIVDEGTMVQKGQWIATLDKSEFQNRLEDKKIEVEAQESQFIQTQLDTTLTMRQARDELINLQYAVEEQEIILEQSQFEPPATIKQAEINLDKAIRALEQAQQNYKIKKQQAIERMKEVAAELRKDRREYDAMMAVEESFTIRAPEPGMVIYKKGFDGRQIKAGSQISVWDPTVATLPDLTTMMSKTYVNEVDVRKVKIGQKVEIGLDAFPEKQLSGQVTRVANVGEQLPNSDAKVFQVDVQIDGTDTSLKPAMTTSNKIIANELKSVLHVPLEALHSKNDSISFVYLREGVSVRKQEVQVGSQNTDEAVILLGLEEGDRIYLSVPAGMTEEPIAMMSELDGKRQIEEVAEEPAENGSMRTITLPDGRTIQVPADGQRGNFQRNGQQNGQERTRRERTNN